MISKLTNILLNLFIFSKMSSEQELLSQLEQLRNKQKEMENTKVNIEFKKQKDYLINKLKKFLDMDIKDYEIISIYNDDNYRENHFNYYFKIEDEDSNLLFRRRVYNRYAQKNFIRYEDSLHILIEFLTEIKALDRKQLKINTSEKKEAKSKMDSGYDTNRIPLFI